MSAFQNWIGALAVYSLLMTDVSIFDPQNLKRFIPHCSNCGYKNGSLHLGSFFCSHFDSLFVATYVNSYKLCPLTS